MYICQSKIGSIYLYYGMPKTHKYEYMLSYLREIMKTNAKIIINSKKPKIMLSNQKEIYCSLSDSHSYGALAFSEYTPVGIDIEYMKSRSKEFETFIGDTEEYDILHRYINNLKFKSTMLWSIKEAAQKADTSIHNIQDYTLTLKNDNILVCRNNFIWEVKFWIKNNFIISLAYQI